MAEKAKNHSGKMGAFMRTVLHLLRRNPHLLEEENFEEFRANMYANIPELADKTKCPNCEALMMEYTFEFDYFDAVLLIAMGNEVNKRKLKYKDFTEANQVHIHKLPTSYTVKSRTTQASKLGLITQLRNENGKRVSGTWVITRRGFEALRGKHVPRCVTVWRGKIEQRTGETTTISQALKKHVNAVQTKIKKRQNVKSDFREVAREYNPSDYYDTEVHTGKLL